MNKLNNPTNKYIGTIYLPIDVLTIRGNHLLSFRNLCLKCDELNGNCLSLMLILVTYFNYNSYKLGRLYSLVLEHQTFFQKVDLQNRNYDFSIKV